MIKEDFDLVVSIVEAHLDFAGRVDGNENDRPRVEAARRDFDHTLSMLRDQCDDEVTAEDIFR